MMAMRALKLARAVAKLEVTVTSLSMPLRLEHAGSGTALVQRWLQED